MLNTVKIIIAYGIFTPTPVGGVPAQAATTPAPTNDMTQGNSGGMMGGGAGMMGSHLNAGSKSGGDMVGMMATTNQVEASQ